MRIISFEYPAQYLATDEWLSLKYAALRRSAYCCSVCRSSRAVDVWARPGVNLRRATVDQLVVYCSRCHRRSWLFLALRGLLRRLLCH